MLCHVMPCHAMLCYAMVQENGRAVLAGERSFGKGIIQSLQELRQGGVAVTIARYETPQHHNINQVPSISLRASLGLLTTSASCASCRHGCRWASRQMCM